MRHGAIPGAVALLALMGSTGTLRAQQWTYGLDVSDLAWRDVAGLPADGCNGPARQSPAAGVSVTRKLGTLPLAVAFTARIHPFLQPLVTGAACQFRPPNAGTYTILSGVNPLARRFATTDARIEFAPHVGGLAPAVAVGGGSLWWNGAPVPYELVAGSLGFRRGRVGITVTGELQRLGLQYDVLEGVYASDPASTGVVLVSQRNLGSSRIWKTARLLAVRFDFAMKTPR
jgi:hypothetical protein